MNEVDSLLRGIAAGLIIAAPIGPVNVLCMQRTLANGWRSGVMSGFGAALGDALYGAVAVLNISLVVHFLIQQRFRIRLLSGSLLVLIGTSYLFKPPERLLGPKDRGNGRSDLASTLLLDLANPTIVLSSMAILAVLGVTETRRPGPALCLSAGIFCGSLLWWIALSTVVNRFRDRFNDRLLVLMNRVAGSAIGGFGVIALALSR